jgi:uncharacterized protein (DUF1501 family)
MSADSRYRSVPVPVPELDAAQRGGRRVFLRQAGAMGLLAGAGAPLALNLLAASHAAAQSATDYRAIVCVFLFGGNDSFNMVLPTDSSSFAAYSSTRNQAPDSIALLAPGTAPVASAAAGSPARLGGVLPINPIDAQGRSFALHPSMGALVPLFDTQRRLAILPNIGPLILPTTKAVVYKASHPKPARLYSHSDQQSTWQTMSPEGATMGWGGRIGDMLAAGNTSAAFTAVSAAGNGVFLSGNLVRQYEVGTNGPMRVAADGAGRVYGSTAVTTALERIVSRSRGGHVMEADLAVVARRSIEAELLLRNALPAQGAAPFGTPVTSGTYNAANDPLLRYTNPITGTVGLNNLAHQFQVVARMIHAGRQGATGVRRQVFFVSLGGFDSHDFQNRLHTDLLARLAHAMAYFDSVLVSLGAQGSVTTFTASEFGRTFISNGDGTDHGWGSHQFVMGGAVRGGRLFGQFPVLATKNATNNNFDGSPDQLFSGILLPTTSVDQLGATLARWMGVSESGVQDIFPNLANWNASARDLGLFNA